MANKERFKVIAVDNYNRENRNDMLICENVNQWYGNVIVKALQDKEGAHSDNFYKLVPMDYKLYVFEP